MEWKRAKWSHTVKKLTKKFEAMAVKHSHHLISDNQGIADYYHKEYGQYSEVLEYGADLVSDFDVNTLEQYGLDPEAISC